MTTQEVRAEKFTPGPWTLCHHLRSAKHDASCGCGYRGSVWSGDGEYIVCEMGAEQECVECKIQAQPDGERSVQLADARLIAASPSMYAALTRAHVVIRDAITLRVPIDGDAEGTLEAVEKALRLALDGAA